MSRSGALFRNRLAEFLVSRSLRVWSVMVMVWVVLFGPAWSKHVQNSLSPTMLCDDARIVTYNFYGWVDSELFRNDVLGHYHIGGTGELYRGLFFLLTQLGDPLMLSKLMAYPLFILTIVGVGVAVYRIGGRLAVFFAVCLCLSTSTFFASMSGALPRAFAYPLIAWIAACLARGQIRWVAVLTVISAGFYPVVTVVGGLGLGFVLIVLPAADRGSATTWTMRRRLMVLTLTALASAALLAPFALRMKPYGASITPDMIAEYPEAGPGGRLGVGDRPPFPPLTNAAHSLARATLDGGGTPISSTLAEFAKNSPLGGRVGLTGLLAIALLGFARFAWKPVPSARRVAALLAALMVAYPLAEAVTPRLVIPQRYAQYVVPILTVIVACCAWLGPLNPKWIGRGWWRLAMARAPAVLLGISILGFYGGRGRPEAGLRRLLPKHDQRILRFMSTLPKEALVAGWPDGVINGMPLASRRTAFLTRELHMPYHTGFTLMTRARMEALVDAYFASDPGPLRVLRDGFGVSHLIIEEDRLEARPSYFKPFSTRVERAHRAGKKRGFFVRQVKPSARIYAEKGRARFILDLSRID